MTAIGRFGQVDLKEFDLNHYQLFYFHFILLVLRLPLCSLQTSHKTDQSRILQDSGSSLLPFKCIHLYHQIWSGFEVVQLSPIRTLQLFIDNKSFLV